jgi:hypothetical protein
MLSVACGLCLALVGCSDDEQPDAVDGGAASSSSTSEGDGTGSSNGPSDEAGTLDDASTDTGFSTSTGSDDDDDDDDGNDDSSTGMVEIEPLVLHLAPDGDDANDGTSWNDAVATIARTHDLVVEHDPERDVLILIAEGTYVRQTVTWTHTMPEHTITFKRADDDGPRPQFVGCDESGCAHTFFILNHSDGEATNLHFEYLQIERYRAAISLQGNRNDFARSNGHNVIYDCYFRRIGNKWNDNASGQSYAVVRLLNSDDNLVRNNHFVECENATNAGLLHALYIAHNAERNHVIKNRFVTHSGDPIRVRDFSNDNSIEENVFIRSSATAMFSDWYCTGDACTKAEPECPSWGNEFRDNELDGDYSCNTASTWHLFGPDAATGCSPPAPDAKRLSTSGNVKTAVPCQGL